MQGKPFGIHMDVNDPQLLLRLRAADPAAFETLVRATSGRLLATARRFLHDDALAQDAVQDAFLQAYKALPAFEARSSLSTWLHTITVRTCLMRLRHDRHHPEARIEDLLPAFAADGHRQEVGPAWQPPEALSSDERALVRASIDKLPPDFRNVLLLRDIEEVDTRGAAELLGISESLVKARLHRARQALRTLLDPHFRKDRS
jgi:RNA polymerase sigma-70 factor (ECF subfamily)